MTANNDVIVPRGLIETIGNGVFQVPVHLLGTGIRGTVDTVKIYSAKDMVTLEFLQRDGCLAWRVNFYAPPNSGRD